MFLGTLGVAVFVFWYREKTKNIYSGEPILTVSPSTMADRSTVENIINLIEFDQSLLDAKKAADLN